MELYKQPSDKDCVPTSLVFLINNFYQGNLNLRETVELARKKYYSGKGGMDIFNIPLLLNDLQKSYSSSVVVGDIDYKENHSQAIQRLRKVKKILGSKLEVEVIDERKFWTTGWKYLQSRRPLLIGFDEDEFNPHSVVVIDSNEKRIDYFDPANGSLGNYSPDFFLWGVGNNGALEIFRIKD